MAAAVVVAFVLPHGTSGSTRRQRRAIEAYEAKLKPIVEEWGRIEVQGMRPAITDLLGGQFPPETVAGEARAWQSGLLELQGKLTALAAPKPLAKAKALFKKAMVRYIDAAKLFEQAADGPPADRKAGVDRGIAAATDGDRLYNQASMVLQKARHHVGLPTTPDVPDHPAGQTKVGS